jgi:hypothetical protein
MSAFQKFDPWSALNTLSPVDAAKAAKAAKVEPKRTKFSDFSDFSDAAAPGEKSHTERRAWSDHLCQRLHKAVARVTPAGLGRWPGAWDRVEAPSKELLDLLAEWEHTGNEADRRAAKDLATTVFMAWRDAAREWRARPLGAPCPDCGEACEECLGEP